MFGMASAQAVPWADGRHGLCARRTVLAEPLSRRAVLRLAAGAGALALAGAAARPALGWMPVDPLGSAAAATDPASGRPNVLLITLDTLRADFLGAYGR